MDCSCAEENKNLTSISNILSSLSNIILTFTFIIFTVFYKIKSSVINGQQKEKIELLKNMSNSELLTPRPKGIEIK